MRSIREVWSREDGQGIGEYAVMLALVVVVVLGTVQLVGSRANHVFSMVVRVFQPERVGD